MSDVWTLPDPHLVVLSKEQKEEIYKTSTSKVILENIDYGFAPSENEVHDKIEEEVGKRELALQRKLRWKNRLVRPKSYTPPVSSNDFRERVSNGETYFEETYFENISFRGFPKEGKFNFNNCRFYGCDFTNGNFDDAFFNHAEFEECTGFDEVSVKNTDFKGAIFKSQTIFSNKSSLEGASFEDANLMLVKGIVFDSNFIFRTKFPTDSSSDIWSSLRMKYNGFSLFLNSLLLLLFIAPFIIKLVSLVSYGHFLSKWNDAKIWLESSLPEEVIVKLESVLETQGFFWTDCLRRDCEYMYAIDVAVTSVGQGFLYQIGGMCAFAVFIYRYYITNQIVPLKEHEDRLSITPSKSQYAKIVYCDKIIEIVKWPMWLFYLYIFYDLATTKIPVYINN